MRCLRAFFVGCAALISAGVQGQTPGQIYETCTTVGNPLDPNNDGFVTASGAAYTGGNLEESTEFEGTGWVVVHHKTTEPTSDLDTGANCGSTELVDNPNTGQRACYIRLVDPDANTSNRNEQLIVRLRVAQHATGAFGYSLLIDTDGKIGSTGANADPNFMSGNPGFELELILGSGGGSNGVKVVNVDGTTSGTQLAFYSGDSRRQRSYAKHSNCGGTPVFMDLYVSLADFPVGITADTPLRYVFATASSPSSALGGSASDIGGIDDTTLPNDDDAFVSVVLSAPTLGFSSTTVSPSITSFTPTTTCPGDTIFVAGGNLTFVDSVYVGGTKATTFLAPTNDSLWVITPTIAGSATGNISVYNDGTAVSSSGYTYGSSCSPTCTNVSACNFGASAACTFATTWYADTDGDGAGDPLTTQLACSQPSGYVASAGDACPSNAAKTAAGVCGCGAVDVDVDADGVCDTSDLCTNNTACNYTANPTAACTFATTWYADTDGDGAGNPAATLSACTQPSGYAATAGDGCPSDVLKTAAGVCGCGVAEVNVDGDTVCDSSDLCTDNTACNYTANPTAACTFATTWYADTDGDGAGDPAATQSACTQPSGYVAAAGDGCPSDVLKTAAGVCGCGVAEVNVDGDTVCDSADLCTDVTATNYSADPTAACTFTTTTYILDGCDAQDSVRFNMDTLTVASHAWTFSVVQGLTGGFATSNFQADTLEVHFSPTGVGTDTLIIKATTGAITEHIKIAVNEWSYPVRTSPLAVAPASSPAMVDGTISTTFTGDYSAPVTLHVNGSTVPMSGGVGVLRSAMYVIEGYTNVKGCYNPEPATSSTPAGTPVPVALPLPCLRCH